jgi:hypothetical protein
MAVLSTSPEGAPQLALIAVYGGAVAEGERVLQPLRAFGSPVADLIGHLPYSQVQRMFDAGFPPGRRHYWKSGFLDELDDAAIAVMVEHVTRVPSSHSGVLIEQYGGAVSRVAPSETAFVHRTSPYNLTILSGWERPADDDANIAWTRGLWAAMQPFTADGAYVNYLGDALDEGADRVRSAYGPATYDRLVALKRQYDPTNLFRLNQNIAPA